MIQWTAITCAPFFSVNRYCLDARSLSDCGFVLDKRNDISFRMERGAHKMSTSWQKIHNHIRQLKWNGFFSYFYFRIAVVLMLEYGFDCTLFQCPCLLQRLPFCIEMHPNDYHLTACFVRFVVVVVVLSFFSFRLLVMRFRCGETNRSSTIFRNYSNLIHNR